MCREMIFPYEYITTIKANALMKIRNKKRKCFVSGCKMNAIQSHVIWKNGILSKIADRSNHLIELNVQKIFRGEKLEFTSTGINSILAFKGFCNQHDHDIFKPIERSNIDFFNIKNQILISVRGLFFELRKKEMNIEWFEEIIDRKSVV